MQFIKAHSREEVLLLPECLDDYVHEESPVRVLDQFVESLDLAELGFEFPRQDHAGRGRPGYHPKFLLKLLIYGYLNGVRSGRKLEKACEVNLEVIWLLQKLKPDFKTICDFRRLNRLAFKQVTREFTHICCRLDLISGEVIAIDGTRVKGLNSPRKNWSRKKLLNHQKRIDATIEKYLQTMEQADLPFEQDSLPDDPSRIEEKIIALRERKAELEAVEKERQGHSDEQLSLTDPDCRAMYKSGTKIVGYNVQTAVDGKHNLIAESEATNDINDMNQLAPMTEKAKETLELENGHVVADKGYYSGKSLKKCEDMGMLPYVPAVTNSPSERKGYFSKKDFIYDSARDCYICPNRKVLLPQSKKRSKSIKQNYRNVRACRNCALRARCTSSTYRSVARSEYEVQYQNAEERMRLKPEIYARRASIVEAPFGDIKQNILTSGFLVKGLAMVNAELSLAHLAHNFKRVMKLVAIPDVLNEIRAF